MQSASRRAWESGRHLRDVALETPEVVDALGRAGVERVFDLQHHLRHVDAIFARVLGGEAA